MKALKGLQPEKVMRYFEEISDVPRESAKEDKIADYMENFARERGLECLRDASNNIVIKKPATAGYEDCDPVILQAVQTLHQALGEENPVQGMTMGGM